MSIDMVIEVSMASAPYKNVMESVIGTSGFRKMVIDIANEVETNTPLEYGKDFKMSLCGYVRRSFRSEVIERLIKVPVKSGRIARKFGFFAEMTPLRDIMQYYLTFFME